ncbi:kinase-like domain-containing protein [Leptodontidium sp. MPI-SDFR-AT-0119]|nr:kinase-like domain-containing protein [Leptodontidium sp. MPI-SDFR-AT-0119]
MAYLSDFEHTKLEAHVFPGMVVQTHYISDSTTGQRRVPQTQIWKVERLLGKGGFGEVRLEAYAEEQRAVKRIWAAGTTFKVEYERELKALLEFSKPKYKRECGVCGVSRVVSGYRERVSCNGGGKVEEAGVKDIAMQILEGLKIMHLERFVHRDLKPKNVLVCRGPPHWWVKLADFGLSKRRTEDTALRTQTGTQAYMAPEILNYIPGHSEYTYAVDIWALGCIIYRLISGVVPFPPGLSLTNFCGDEERFPSKALEMILERSLLTAGEALDHAWIKPNPLTSDASLGHLIVPEGASNIDVSASFGAYNTVTHVGLQSYGTQDSTVTAKSPNAAAQPVNNYHPPTVEDAYEVDDNTVVASDLKGDVTGDEQDIQPDINTQSSSQQGPGCGPGTNSTPPLQQAEERVEKISESLRAALCGAEIRAGELEQAKRAPARSPVEHVRKARDKDRRRDAEAKHSRRYIMEDSSSGEERKAQLQLDADRNTPERVSSKKKDPRDYERGKLTREGPRRRQVWVEDESSDDELRRRESLRSDTAARARLYPGHPAEAPLDPKWAEHVNFAGAYMQAQQRKNSQRQPAAKGESSNTPLRNPPTMRRAETFSTSPDYNKAPMNERLSEHRGSVGKYMAAARRKVAHEEEPQDTMSPVASTTPGNVRYGYAPDLPQHADEDGYLTPSYFAAAHRRNPSRHPGTRRAETFSPPQDPAY